MKTKLVAMLSASLILVTATQSHAVVITPITSVGTNITNNGVALVGDIASSAIPGGNSPQVMFDWIDAIGTIVPGQISQYNTITSSSLPQPTGDPFNPFILDASGGNNSSGYSLLGNFYAVVHYGKGSGGEANSAVAWYLPSVSGTYSFPQSGLGPNGVGGISSVRIWQTTKPGDGPGRKVPDGGTTVAALGFALLGLGSMRKLIGSKA